MSAGTHFVWVELKGRGNLRRGAHDFTAKILNWWYCRHCGLVTLRNAATERARRAPCEWVDE